MNHYDYLNENLQAFFAAVGVKEVNNGIITDHGDKCYGYRDKFGKAGIPFNKGVAIYLLTYCYPYSKESRETANGWVDPASWVIANKDKFLKFLP